MSRNIRQRCQLKYSKHGTFTWVDKKFFLTRYRFLFYIFKDKWIEYDCIFSSAIDVNNRQRNQLELHPKNNIQGPHGQTIDLTRLVSLTCVHGNINKNEPKDIIILKIDGKRHRLGFDDIYVYNQWKALLDGVFNSSWNKTNENQSEENATVNMLYESATGKQKFDTEYLRTIFL
jgi:hypothetical protein